MPKVKIAWVKSGIGCPQGQRRTIRALGLKRLHQVVEQPDSPSVRGMIGKVKHLLRIEVVD